MVFNALINKVNKGMLVCKDLEDLQGHQGIQEHQV